MNDQEKNENEVHKKKIWTSNEKDKKKMFRMQFGFCTMHIEYDYVRLGLQSREKRKKKKQNCSTNEKGQHTVKSMKH